MVTTPIPPEPEPNPARVLLEKANAATRVAVAGSPVGAVRRILLYVVTALTLLTLATAGGPVDVAIGGLGLLALLLNAMTDRLA